ncbi:MAG TPA: nucleoid-associated protein [Candidatus Scybalocola faecavium]|nr:nucleoid-associated protein [Candidatus Scybalocola faecavium]
MKRDDIIIQKAIIHILDASVGMPVLSDRELSCGPDLYDFFRAHLEKITESDDVKQCSFSPESEIRDELSMFEPENFTEVSQKLAAFLYSIMNSNIDIPSADLAVLLFRFEEQDYLGILKMNYKSSYTHLTVSDLGENTNNIIKQKALLPSEGQKLSEAAVIRLSDLDIMLLEKKYEVNGVKTNYMSELYLKCHGKLSQKARLNIVTKAVDQINQKYFDEEDVQRSMETKKVLYDAFEEAGGLNVETVKEKLFAENEDMRRDFEEKIEKYHIDAEEIRPVNKQTIKKFERQFIKTDTGIEISIPMDQYDNQDIVEFITNSDGSISVLIKNISHMTSK